MVESERRDLDYLVKELENGDGSRREDAAELLAEEFLNSFNPSEHSSLEFIFYLNKIIQL